MSSGSGPSGSTPQSSECKPYAVDATVPNLAHPLVGSQEDDGAPSLPHPGPRKSCVFPQHGPDDSDLSAPSTPQQTAPLRLRDHPLLVSIVHTRLLYIVSFAQNCPRRPSWRLASRPRLALALWHPSGR